MTPDLFGQVGRPLATIQGIYRYELYRKVADSGPLCAWVMLNPSIADDRVDDPTIRRCKTFSRAWGFGEIVVVNLFALRATDPAQLLTADGPVGPENNAYIAAAAAEADVVVCAWGAHKFAATRAEVVLKLVQVAQTGNGRIRCLGTTKDGHPRHPLYVRGDAELIPFGEAMA